MFERLERMIGKNELQTLQQSHVLLIGIGGVGGYVLEALVRSGIGTITIWDYDTIDLTNLNRQVITHSQNIGHLKGEEAKIRALLINPTCQIHLIQKKAEKADILNFDFSPYDFVVDACDDVVVKTELIKAYWQQKFFFVSSLGTGNRMKPEMLMLTTLDKTYNDPLAKKIRSLLRKEKLSLKVPVVWSNEIPFDIKNLGTFCPVPMAAGSILTSYVIRQLLHDFEIKKSSK